MKLILGSGRTNGHELHETHSSVSGKQQLSPYWKFLLKPGNIYASDQGIPSCYCPNDHLCHNEITVFQHEPVQFTPSQQKVQNI